MIHCCFVEDPEGEIKVCGGIGLNELHLCGPSVAGAATILSGVLGSVGGGQRR
jgi:hypothetical protein